MFALLIALAAAAPEPATCLIVGRQLDHKVVDEQTLMVRAGGRWHRSVLPDGCPGLQPNRSLVRREASPRLCANDLFEVRDNFTPEVFSLCRFGRFEALPKGTRP
ncbi:hypothetical protein [Sandarakinorhabdus sp.]|uniref:hypothetical protein n=1 Tax=Sandarakinorhabdus sp. TaxID=1916663 RepID=UPI003F700939